MELKVTVLLCLCLSGGRALHVSQPYRIVASNGTLRLPCSYQLGAPLLELQVTLYQGMYGDETICSSYLNITGPQFSSEGSIHCEVQLSLSGVVLIVSGLQGADSDLYRCKVEVIYPPPYRTGMGNGTIFHIPEKSVCQQPEAQKQQDKDDSTPLLLLIATSVFLLAMLLVLIAIAVTLRSLVRRENKWDFLGSTPVAPRRIDCRFGYERFL